MNLSQLHASQSILVLLGLLIFLAIPADSMAYDRWSQDDDATYCGACHGDFRNSSYVSPTDGMLWGNLHNIHRTTMLNGDCDACHGNNLFPVYMASAQGGNGLDGISCMGCHGREEDNVASNPESPNGFGAGLRQHHQVAGVTICLACHEDSDPANYTTVGEDILPPFYANPGSGHPNIPTDGCNEDGSENFAGDSQGQDNDGDGSFDGDDGDCIESPVPDVASLELQVSNFPNPFNPQTTISYTIDQAGSVRVAVYSVDGKLVRVMSEGYVDAGSHSVRWNGTDANGRPMNSGQYLCRLETNKGTVAHSMVLVR